MSPVWSWYSEFLQLLHVAVDLADVEVDLGEAGQDAGVDLVEAAIELVEALPHLVTQVAHQLGEFADLLEDHLVDRLRPRFEEPRHLDHQRHHHECEPGAASQEQVVGTRRGDAGNGLGDVDATLGGSPDAVDDAD